MILSETQIDKQFVLLFTKKAKEHCKTLILSNLKCIFEDTDQCRAY